MIYLLAILTVIAMGVAIAIGLQLGGARDAAAKAREEAQGTKTRLQAVEAESRRQGEVAEAKRREIDELKEQLRDAKRRRHEERESEKFQRDAQRMREEIEHEMEKRLARAREETEEARAVLRKQTAEMDALRSRRATPAPFQAPNPAEPQEVRRREAKPEEVARLEAAEKALAESREKYRELDAELKRMRGRAETDRRVFLVQKGEIDLSKDKFRALEARHNQLTRERDELRRSLYELEKSMKGLLPTAPGGEAETSTAAPEETSAPKPEIAEAPSAAEPRPEGSAPVRE